MLPVSTGIYIKLCIHYFLLRCVVPLCWSLGCSGRGSHSLPTILRLKSSVQVNILVTLLTVETKSLSTHFFFCISPCCEQLIKHPRKANDKPADKIAPTVRQPPHIVILLCLIMIATSFLIKLSTAGTPDHSRELIR